MENIEALLFGMKMHHYVDKSCKHNNERLTFFGCHAVFPQKGTLRDIQKMANTSEVLYTHFLSYTPISCSKY